MMVPKISKERQMFNFTKPFAAIAMCLLAACATNTPASTADVPLPSNVHVIPPGPEVSPRFAAWSGFWYGKWITDNGSVSVVLVVESVDVDGNVSGIYAWGTDLAAGQTPGYRVFKSNVSRGLLNVGSGRESWFLQNGDGTLSGRHLFYGKKNADAVLEKRR